ncbi:hypothetical protein A1OU_07570 [Enterovibrio norvegicus]|nr:hypothetical protein A1OU_07570 [Enterovibrio norvegicus]
MGEAFISTVARRDAIAANPQFTGHPIRAVSALRINHTINLIRQRLAIQDGGPMGWEWGIGVESVVGI